MINLFHRSPKSREIMEKAIYFKEHGCKYPKMATFIVLL